MHPTHFEEFMLFSADSDFTPVLQKLREYDRRTSCVVLAGMTSGALRASADEILQLTELLTNAKGAGNQAYMQTSIRNNARPTPRISRRPVRAGRAGASASPEWLRKKPNYH